MARTLLLAAIALGLSACSALPMSCRAVAYDRTVYVVGDGWHTDIGIPVAELGPQLGFYRAVFPGARVLMFGYGKKTFFTAPARGWREYVLGPVPGPAVIQIFGLSAPPPDAYDPQEVRALSLTPEGEAALTAMIWNDLAKGVDGKPVAVAPSVNPAGLFYEARSEYSLHHTCNGWAAAALQAAQLPVGGGGVVLSSQLMARVDPIAARQCLDVKGRNR